MSSGVNKVILVGNLGADPEVRYTQSGQPVANLRLATTEYWNDREGQRQERTEWHSITVWGKQGEHCGNYLSKGRQVYVEGRLQSREYTDRDGVNRKVWDVVANNVVFLQGGDRQGQGRGGSFQGRDESRGAPPPPADRGGSPQGDRGGPPPSGGGGGGGGGFDDDPIPF